MSTSKNVLLTPRIIIHGGAGNITRTSISRERYHEYQVSLQRILSSSATLLSKPGATALDVATFAVTLLENDPLYNSGKGAVFTRAGTNELECSVMVSNGYQKRGVGLMLLKHVKNPIKLARELLIKGEERNGGGAQDHCQYSGEYVEGLAKEWGLDIVDEGYFWTKSKWEEHKRGLKEEKNQSEKVAGGSGENKVDVMSDWEKENYIPLGTCGAVVLDSFGAICVATSTGGLTNKLPGRIGDTPTMGTGYWAEEWFESSPKSSTQMIYQPSPSTSHISMDKLSRGDISGLLGHCMPSISHSSSSGIGLSKSLLTERPSFIRHAVGLSGSGNGDSFIRMIAARTTAAKSRFASTSLSDAITWMAGPGGELQKSAGDRWGKVHEGIGGIIGIELVGTKSAVLCDYNCGGMFRAWTDKEGKQRCLIFREDDYDSGPKGWSG
ncbi:N-terminal nucleophile aminohydrolase [Amniculicola lignicola CBS 123094]|uniref:N-terminal nucleophile aminohydrolase n=1 Tax=Amniculicola lignicola CBS 123094 TaxID=1392246 RepID=A0A6A5VZ15_9PLEO|nr:N-terminal nucleophile aminohydrolase [Amniculicola lignicola CBS 123094]